MVVIQELFGLNDNIRRIANRLAGEGYIALAPNLYSRPGGFGRFCVTSLMKAMLNNGVEQQPVRDLKAAVAYLQQQPFVHAERIGVTGFCMGGGYAILLACASDQVKGSVAFYGRNPSPIDAVANIRCPLLYPYGASDRLVRGGVPKLKEALKRQGKQYEVKAYPNTGHSYMNDSRRSYRRDVAEGSWKHLLAFFGEHLKETP